MYRVIDTIEPVGGVDYQNYINFLNLWQSQVIVGLHNYAHMSRKRLILILALPIIFLTLVILNRDTHNLGIGVVSEEQLPTLNEDQFLSQHSKVASLDFHSFSWRFHPDYIVAGEHIYFLNEKGATHTIPSFDGDSKTLISQQSQEAGKVLVRYSDLTDVKTWGYDFIKDDLYQLSQNETDSILYGEKTITSNFELINAHGDLEMALVNRNGDEISNWNIRYYASPYTSMSLNNEDVIYHQYFNNEISTVFHYDITTNTHTSLYSEEEAQIISSKSADIFNLDIAHNGSNAIVIWRPVYLDDPSNVKLRSLIHIFDTEKICLIAEELLDTVIVDVAYSPESANIVAFTTIGKGKEYPLWFMDLEKLPGGTAIDKPCLNQVNLEMFESLVVPKK